MPSMLPPLLIIRALKDLADFAQIPALAGILGVASVLLEDVQVSGYYHYILLQPR